MKKQLDIRFWILFAILAIVGVWRVWSTSTETGFLQNFSPVGAMALFAGVYFSNQYKAFLTPIIILLVSDLIIMQVIYPEYSNGLLYDGWYWTYIGFLGMVTVGFAFRNQKVLTSVIAGGLIAGTVHFLISNFGVWLGGGLSITGQPYASSFSGLLEVYVAGIPFFKNMLAGNLIFGAALFGTFELIKSRVPSLAFASK